MRIGIMLRSYEEKGGIGVYTRNLVSELLRIDQHNEYVLFFRKEKYLGTFNKHPNVEERLVPGENKAYWDQIAIPFACRREKIDLIFNPKFTAPLLAPCKAVMVVHGADWFIPEQAQYYSWLDVHYIRIIMPWYFKKCSKIISVSELTTDNFYQVLDLPDGKVQTVYFAPARHFQRIDDREKLDKVKRRYELPDNFILTLTRRGFGGDRRKNLGQIFRAYGRYHEMSPNPIPMVVGGKEGHLLKEDYGVPTDGYGSDIIFPGWIEQIDLPAVYSLASVYLYPSNLEAFPIPVTEAMACGTPLITSNVNGLEELAGDAAVLVDPRDTEAIAKAICDVVEDPQLRATLSAKGLKRSELFSWDKCARETLSILESTID